jgi:hypothetical protein
MMTESDNRRNLSLGEICVTFLTSAVCQEAGGGQTPVFAKGFLQSHKLLLGCLQDQERANNDQPEVFTKDTDR